MKKEKRSAWLAAKYAGLTQYEVDYRCRRNHESRMRYVVNNWCVECARLSNYKHKHGGFEPLPCSRVEARKLGEIKYLTGKRCARGHAAPRYVNTGACVRCIAYYAQKDRPTRLALEAHVNDHDEIVAYAKRLAGFRLLGLLK
jgi:hypothetical protein